MCHWTNVTRPLFLNQWHKLLTFLFLDLRIVRYFPFHLHFLLKLNLCHWTQIEFPVQSFSFYSLQWKQNFRHCLHYFQFPLWIHSSCSNWIWHWEYYRLWWHIISLIITLVAVSIIIIIRYNNLFWLILFRLRFLPYQFLPQDFWP